MQNALVGILSRVGKFLSAAPNRKTTILAMKLTASILLISCLSSSAAANSQTITFTGKELRLERFFEEIEHQTGYYVVYNKQLVSNSHPISVDVKGIPVNDFLNLILKDQALTFTIRNKNILIAYRSLPEKKIDSSLQIAPPIVVTGRVLNARGEPMQGVSVTLKNTGKGTSTNSSGEFSIQLSDAKPGILVFSYIGFQDYQLAVTKSANIVVRLTSLESSEQEVVVVGYGTQRRSEITGAVSSVKTKDLTQIPTRRVDQALQGRVAGLLVQNDNASPNAPVTLRIRGINSVNGGNDPLVVIDGMQLGTLSTLNPNEVESIEVLKDASATAIYGARGANGVIIVTTKKGKTGKPVVSYNSAFTVSNVRRKLPQLNAEQYALTVNANRADFNAATIFTDEDIAYFKTHSVNWQDVIFRQGFTQDHQLSISGANDNTSYSVSATANDQSGIIKGTSFNGYSIRSNLRTQISSKLSVGLNMFANRTMSHPTTLNTYSGSNAASPIFSALQFAPTKPIYEADGSYSKPGGGYGPPSVFNPLALAIEPVTDNLSSELNTVADIEYKITRKIKINVLGAYKNLIGESSYYYNSKPSGSPGTEQGGITNTKLLLLQNTNMVTYEDKFGLHSLKVTGVVEQQAVKNNGNTASSVGFLSDAVRYNNLSLGSNPQIPSSSVTSSALLSYMARVNYGFNDRYSITLTGRYDGSSVFGAEHKWGFFPSVGAAWNVTNEPFFNFSQRIVHSLKLRVSYGIVGNQAINPYQSLSSLNNNLLYVLNGSTASLGVGLGKIENKELRWEKTAQFNVGVDADFLDGRLTLSADYYDKKTSDLLFSVKLPAIGGGAGSILRNVGSMQNRGVEIYVGGQPLVGAFKWETGFTISFNRNKLLELYDDLKELPLGDPGIPGFGNTIWLEKGQPIGLLRGFVMNGVWKTSEASQAAEYGALPGYPKYEDQNNDKTINNSDIVNIGNTQPKFIYGWNNGFSFKGFDLSFFFQGVQGNNIYNVSRVRFDKTNTDADATSIRILDRWTPTHENTDIPSFVGSVVGEQNQSTRWMEDGSYLRLKNLTIGYTLSGLKKNILHISSARIYLAGTNLFTETAYSGFEPEARTGVDSLGGIDLATYPSQKSYSIGLNVKF